MEWPVEDRSTESFKLPELKNFALTVRADTPSNEQILRLFSSFTHCVNVLTWVFRFLSRCRKENKKDTLLRLALAEIQETETKLFLLHQKEFYSKEIKTLHSGASLSNTNPLCSLFPILDKVGLMRVGGRLQQANLSYQQKHPLIVCRKSHLALLLVRHVRISNHHAGPTMMLGLLSQQYYMSGTRL